jgi:hypothetical protein
MGPFIYPRADPQWVVFLSGNEHAFRGRQYSLRGTSLLRFGSEGHPSTRRKRKMLPSDEVDPTGITVWTKENISRGRPPG